MEQLPFSIGAIASLLGMDAGEILEALQEGEELKPQSDLDKWLNDQISSRMSQAHKRGKEEGHGRGKRESLTAKEKEIRERYNLEGSGSLDELLEELVTGLQSHKADPADIKKSSVYLEDTKSLKEKIVALQQQLEKEADNNRRNLIRVKLNQIVPEILEESKFIIPEDETIRRNLLNLLYEKMEDENVLLKEDDEGNLIPFSRETDRPLEGSNFQPVAFPAFLTERARMFFTQGKASASKKSPGNQTKDDEGGKTSFSFPTIKTHDQFMKAMNKMRMDGEAKEKREAFKEHYEQLVKDGQVSAKAEG